MKFYSTLSTAIILVCCSSSSFAFFCPGNFNQINFGDSIETVQRLCGPAANKEVKDPPDNSPQEWNYYTKQTGQMTISNSAQGTLKTSFAFDGNGKLVNISVNDIGVASTSNCGSPVSLGDTREAVQSACGKPGFVSKQNDNKPAAKESGPEDETNKLVELTYTSTPPVTLIFEGGKLTGKR